MISRSNAYEFTIIHNYNHYRHEYPPLSHETAFYLLNHLTITICMRKHSEDQIIIYQRTQPCMLICDYKVCATCLHMPMPKKKRSANNNTCLQNYGNYLFY